MSPKLDCSPKRVVRLQSVSFWGRITYKLHVVCPQNGAGVARGFVRLQPLLGDRILSICKGFVPKTGLTAVLKGVLGCSPVLGANCLQIVSVDTFLSRNINNICTLIFNKNSASISEQTTLKL